MGCSAADDEPFFTPNRKGRLFFFKAKLSSSGLQNLKTLLIIMLTFNCVQYFIIKSKLVWNYLWTTSWSLTPSLIGTVFLNSSERKHYFTCTKSVSPSGASNRLDANTMDEKRSTNPQLLPKKTGSLRLASSGLRMRLSLRYCCRTMESRASLKVSMTTERTAL